MFSYHDYLERIVYDESRPQGVRDTALEELRRREDLSRTLWVPFGTIIIALVACCIAQFCVRSFPSDVTRSAVGPTTRMATTASGQAATEAESEWMARTASALVAAVWAT